MKTLLGFIKKEFLQTLRDPRMRILLFVAPCVQLTIFGVALSSEAKNIRLSLVGAPGDAVLQTIYRNCLASGWFIPAKVTSLDPFTQMQNDETDAVMVAPAGGLDKSLGKERNQGQIQLLINAINVTRGQSIERYFMAVLQGQFKKKIPLQFNLRVLYNPALRSAYFLIPGVMSLLVCFITILLTSMSIAKEKELGTFESLIAAPVRTEEVLLGKTIPFAILGMTNIFLIMLVAIFFFNLPLRGSIWWFLLSSLVFVFCTVGIGLLISTLVKNQQQSMMGGFLFLFPSMLLSGLVFPIENMPWLLRIFSYINPLTYFIEILRNITLKGGDAHLLLFDIAILAAMTVASIFVSWWRFKTTL